VNKKKPVRKLKIEKIGELEQDRTCGNCRYWLKAGAGGICIQKILFKYNTQTACEYFRRGKTEALTDLDKIAILEKYLDLDINIKLLQEELKALKLLISEHFKHKERIENFIVYVNDIESKRLDTEKVKELIEQLENKDEFYKISKYKQVRVKKVI